MTSACSLWAPNDHLQTGGQRRLANISATTGFRLSWLKSRLWWRYSFSPRMIIHLLHSYIYIRNFKILIMWYPYNTCCCLGYALFVCLHCHLQYNEWMLPPWEEDTAYSLVQKTRGGGGGSPIVALHAVWLPILEMIYCSHLGVTSCPHRNTTVF